ncbi:hypothetical protein [Pontixanthobacter sp.]|uniref:hypothetical protein n=1 Tax=Pontixanthobacter sp. TaxID=2792078 RepID=UPI003C7DC0AB
MAAICIPAAIPPELCAIDDELKAIYHSADSVCIWVFKSRKDRNRFVEESAGMVKSEREALFARYLHA